MQLNFTTAKQFSSRNETKSLRSKHFNRITNKRLDQKTIRTMILQKSQKELTNKVLINCKIDEATKLHGKMQQSEVKALQMLSNTA